MTITEMAAKLGLSYITTKQRLRALGIKPITKEAIYEDAAFEAIKTFRGRGRPPKEPKTP